MRNRSTTEQRKASQAIFSQLWDSVMPAASASALRYFRSSKRMAPPRLLHFTDMAGIAGIVGGRTLRLTRARSSNDSTELRYGLDIARQCLDGLPGKNHWTQIFKEEVKNCWDGKPFFQTIRPFPEPHICCLSVASSTNEASIPLWSMYGRGGSGAVVVFDGRALARKDQVDLVKVIYNRRRQVAVMSRVLRIGLEACARGRGSASPHGETSAEKMYRILAHAFGALASMQAAIMKRPEFSFENEWRLMVSYVSVEPPEEEKAKQLKASAYASGDVLKSYYECPIEARDLKGIVIGPGLAEFNEPVVRMLLDYQDFAKSVKVRVGTTALRSRFV